MAEDDALSRQRALIARVAESLGPSCTWHETHISLVLVAGGFAWKFKKAVHFDFLDFSTLDKRRFYCEEELRLNRRFAPDIYLDVVAVSGDPGQPVLGGDGVPIEYAVKMRAFDQASVWSERIALGRLSHADIDAWSERLAGSHQEAARAAAESPWCTPAALQAIADETLDLVNAALADPAERANAGTLRAWEERQREVLRDSFLARKAGGYIRECHGDLHCGNILTENGKVEAFDCIEFNESMRWIDVMNDIAFTCMDLRFRGHGELAARLLNDYLERTGDYGGLPVFSYYEVHRALIRCKVALLAGRQGDRNAALEASRYLAFAMGRFKRPAPAIVITHGFSGSGKSTLARAVVEEFDAVQLRSDIERKRIHGVSALGRSAAGIYTEDATREVYRRLSELARIVTGSGWTAVVDATFLLRGQREQFRALARALDVRFVILSAQADEDEMRRRVAERAQRDDDPSDAGLEVLDRQLASHEDFTDEEARQVCRIDTAGEWRGALRERLAALLA